MKNVILTVCLVLMAGVTAFGAAEDGTWIIQTSVSGGPQTLSLAVNGAALSGTIDGNQISSGGVNGSKFWFKAIRNGVAYSYKGSANGNQITLSEYTIQMRTFTFVKNTQ